MQQIQVFQLIVQWCQTQWCKCIQICTDRIDYHLLDIHSLAKCTNMDPKKCNISAICEEDEKNCMKYFYFAKKNIRWLTIETIHETSYYNESSNIKHLFEKREKRRKKLPYVNHSWLIMCGHMCFWCGSDVELSVARRIASRDKNASVLSNNNKRTFIIPSASRLTIRITNEFIPNVTNRHTIWK